MSHTIEIRGNVVDNVATADTITLEALGVKPFLLDESLERRYNGGIYRRIGRWRLAFDIVFNDFVTPGSSTWQDSREYFALMEILSKRYVWLYDVGSAYSRIKDGSLGLIADSRLTLPLAVQMIDVPSFGDDFEAAINTVDGLVLASIEQYSL